VYVFDLISGQSLSNYDINFSSLNYTTWTGESYSGVTNYSLKTINNSMTISVDVDGYSTFNTTINVSVTGDTNISFYLRLENSVNISIYDETTNTLLDNIDIYVDIIQESQTYNLSTSNGTMYVTGIDSGEVAIRYGQIGDSDFDGRGYFLTLINRSYQEIRLYLLNDTLSSLIILDVVDEQGRNVESGIIKCQRFYPEENRFRTIAMGKTNFDGKSSIDLVKKETKSNVLYKFIIEVDEIVRKETIATEINPLAADILFFTINLQEDVFLSWDGMKDVQYLLSFNDTLNQFTYSWSDTTGLVRYGCLNVKRHTPLYEESVCSECETSTAATLICNITNQTDSIFIANAQIETNTNNSLYTVATASWNFNQKWIIFGDYGPLLALLFIGTLTMVGIWNPIVAVITCITAFIFSLILGFLSISYVSAVTLIIIGAIAIFKMRT